MAERNDTGKEGEAIARKYLLDREYVILHSNWHWHHYELDIVAMKEGELVVVEVKTRAEDFLVDPEEAIDKGKIRRIVSAADAYVRFFDIDLPVRFDVMILIGRQGNYRVEHIEDAFYAPCR
ncbi:MAG: YraN family protein [Parabacteroides sp.]|nr:YraN family protein [Parabacteroides sp.]